MSGALPLIVAAASAGLPAEPEPLRNDVSIALPSLDGLRGIQVAYERLLPKQLGLSASIQIRQAAVGDYGGTRAGLGGELRRYFGRSRFGTHAPGSMVGWYLGARVDVAIDTTTDTMTDRSLGTTLEIGTSSSVGYRLAPWRGLEITPSVGLTYRLDVDLSGRLPPWSRPGIAGGLAVGWLF